MSNICYPFLGSFVVTSPFGLRSASESYVSKNHYGIDLVGQGNKTVVSVTDGVVARIDYQAGGYGNYVWVKNNDGTGAIYAHLKSVSCKVGQSVTCKTPLGIEGSTGASTGSHLHFGISRNQDYSTTHTNKSAYFFNPSIYFGIENYSNIKGKTFNGTGMIEGTAAGTISTNTTVTSSNSNSIGNMIVPSGEYWEIKDLTGVTKDWLYGRRYRCIVDLGNNQAFDVSQLRCQFEIVKSCYLEANQSTITIFNLSPNSENKLIKSGQRIIIEAGYNGDAYGKIFEGNVIQPIRSKENGVDYKLTLVSMDSDRYIAYGLVGVALVAQQSMRDAIDACTSKATVPTEQGYILDTQINYPRGKILFGKATTYLNQIAKSVNGSYYNSDGTVNIISAAGLPDNTILDIGPQTGLIGSPTQVEYGIKFQCLLNPMIDVNSLVHIDNKKIEGYRYQQGEAIRELDNQGIYRVIRLTHRGDTRGSDWITECEAITQAGMLPAMAVGNDVYIY